jgi:hypothetical protein
MKKFIIKISDNTGHTELLDQEVSQAVTAITDKVAQHAHWVWIDGQLFEFDGGDVKSEANQQKLAARLNTAEDTNVVLSGTLVGGSK